MKKNKNIASKILAFLALMAILFSIISVWLSFVFSPSSQNIEFTPEELEWLKNAIENDESISPENILEIKENIIEKSEEINNNETQESNNN